MKNETTYGGYVPTMNATAFNVYSGTTGRWIGFVYRTKFEDGPDAFTARPMGFQDDRFSPRTTLQEAADDLS